MFNYVTKKEYTGTNITALYASKIDNGFESEAWMTYRQALEVGRVVSKGQKGTRLRRVIKGVYKDDDGKKKARKGVRGFTVFNLEQTEALQEAV